MKNTIAFLILAAMALLPTAAGLASPSAEAAQKMAEDAFSKAERAAIEAYFGLRDGDRRDGRKKARDKDRKGLPPGLEKKDRLPPGLEKQLQRNGPLPPGLVKNDLPAGLQNKLYPSRPGTRRYIVGDDVVLIDTATDIVLDIIRGVARAQRP